MGSTCQQACWCFVDSHSPSVSREGLVPRTTWWNDETLPWMEWWKLCHSNIPMTNGRLLETSPRVLGDIFMLCFFLERKKQKQTFQNMWCWMKLFDSLLPNSQGFFQTEVCSWLRTTQTIDWWTPPQNYQDHQVHQVRSSKKWWNMIPWSPLKGMSCVVLSVFCPETQLSQVLNLFSSL